MKDVFIWGDKDLQRHAISVARVKEKDLVIPPSLHFNAKEYALMDHTILSETQDKANYLYSVIREKYMKSNPRLYSTYLKYIKRLLLDSGVSEVVFEDENKEYTYQDIILGRYVIGWTGVEFSDKFFKELLYNTRRFKSFLFSKKSVVEYSNSEVESIVPRSNSENVSYGWKWYASGKK